MEVEVEGYSLGLGGCSFRLRGCRRRLRGYSLGLRSEVEVERVWFEVKGWRLGEFILRLRGGGGG